MRLTRFLRNSAVTPEEMAEHAAGLTRDRVAGRDILLIQDTTELLFPRRTRSADKLGPVGKGGMARGMLLHAGLVVDATSRAVLGLGAAQVWTREGGKRVAPRQGRATQAKESQRWVDGAAAAARFVGTARSVTVVADCEGDMYAAFAGRPAGVDVLCRSARERLIIGTEQDDERLSVRLAKLAETSRVRIDVPAAPGRAARTATLTLRYDSVRAKASRPLRKEPYPPHIDLWVVDAQEIEAPRGIEPLHWRLLTTHRIETEDDAMRMIELYRARWLIEQYFLTLKSAGINIEEAAIGNITALRNLVCAAAIAAVAIFQLVQARDARDNRAMALAFEANEQRAIEAISATLEGNTERQKNPHPKGSLAFATWVLARLGGWTGYYGKPGPKVIARGLHSFYKVLFASRLALADV
jgi:hypothetical protein